MRPRLVVTGMGVITPIGSSLEDYWNNLVAGQSGIGEITKFDASRLPVRIAAEIRNFAGASIIPRQLLRSASPFMEYALAAASQALSQSGLDAQHEGDMIGVCMATAMAGITEMNQSVLDYEASSTGKVSPHLTPRLIGNMAAALVSIMFGLHGPGLTLTTACSAGSDAILSAALLLLAGEAQAMLVMGGESILTAPVVSSLAQAKALSRRNEQPQKASRPFDLMRDGFVIGEGGGALVLETEAHAKKRGAKIFAELAGWGNSLDGYHVTAPDPTGAGAAQCMERALKRAALAPEEIDYINAHGTSTPLGDKAETLAMKKVFGANPPPASSTKGATGHLMGAGGLTEIIACVQAIQNGLMPPTLNLEHPDPDCDLDYVPLKAREKKIKTAMSNSLGFGGQNSSIIVAAYS